MSCQQCSRRALPGYSVRAVVVLAMTLRSVRNDGVSWSIGDTLREGLLELAAVLPDTAIDNGRRRHPLEDVVAVVCGIVIAEWGSGMGIFDGDILLTAVLTVEVKNVFDGLEVAGFILISGGIFDVVEDRFVFTGGCNSGSGISVGSLVAVVSAAVSVFFLQSGSMRAASKRSRSVLSSTDSMFCSVTNWASAASGIIFPRRYSVRTAR